MQILIPRELKKNVLDHVAALPIGSEVKLVNLVDNEILVRMSNEDTKALGRWFRKHVMNTDGFPMFDCGKDAQNHRVYRKINNNETSEED